MAPSQALSVPTGDFQLARPHTPASSPLRAWSAADQVLLDHLGTGELGRTLIVNDEFGALSTALAVAKPTVWTDSALSRNAIDANLAANDAAPMTESRTVPGDEYPQGVFDTVVIRIPKTLALLAHQLGGVGQCLSPATLMVGAGMVRHIHTSTLETFETLIGPTTTSLAKRKARLIHVEPRPGAAPAAPAALAGFVTDANVQVAEGPGTFSAGHLDVGTALLLDVLRTQPEPASGATVADLGTGNGVVASTLATQWPQASFQLFDVSDLAIAAANETWHRNDLANPMTALAVDGFGDAAPGSIDVVATNPPFHQGHAVDTGLTDRLLSDTARVLTTGGVAYVVVQRHMKLHATIKRWFGSVEVLSKHPSHVVLKATAPGR